MKDCEREPVTFQGFTFSAGDSGIRFDSEISLERLGVEEGAWNAMACSNLQRDTWLGLEFRPRVVVVQGAVLCQR